MKEYTHHCNLSFSFTIGNIRAPENLALSDTEYSGEEDTHSNSDNCCVDCLSPRTKTWIFIPCKHANFCTDCSNTIEELGQPCPVCCSSIQSRFEIYTNKFIHLNTAGFFISSLYFLSLNIYLFIKLYHSLYVNKSFTLL